MRSSRPFLIAILALLAVSMGAAPLVNLYAQSNTVTISLAIPDGFSDILNSKLLGEFESSHPGVKVNLVKSSADIQAIGAAAQGLDKHFDAFQKYASSADVLYVSVASGTVSAEAARAGYLLDLAPLVSEDKSVNPDDFFPSIWQSFQWDKGIWAMPFAADAYILLYNPDAFDKAGLAYPNEKWTIDDLSNAIRKLAVLGPDGKVQKPGMDLLPFYQSYTFRGIANTSFIDTSTIPNTPHFATTDVANLLDTWLKLDKDGYIGTDFNKAPLSIAPAIDLVVQAEITPGEKREGSLLPGGVAMIDAQGFAVSGGTQYPEQAYALAAWLTTRGEVANNGGASTPARKSLLGGPTSDQVAFKLNVTPEIQALIDKAVANAIPASEFRFVDYVAAAYTNMKTDNVDALSALQQAESDAIKAQQTAAAKKDTLKNVLAVATPVPASNLAAGKVAIKFGVGAGLLTSGAIPNKDTWDKLIADFTGHDQNIAQVSIELSRDSVANAAKKYDCFYLPYNAVSADNISKLLPLDPYIAADSTFDKADMIGSTMAWVQRDNKTWALPTDISPNVLKYDPAAFEKAGVPAPALDWTTAQFADALKQLKTDASTKAAFVPQNTFGSYMLTLIAAYGGLPIDYRTNPPTINFTDPATVDAIQQVADLAKKGYIKYRPLFGGQLDLVLAPETGVIIQGTLSAFAFRSPLDLTKTDTYKMTLYPRGSAYNAVSYQIGALYISASTPNPEACYRWISQIARTPGLAAGMPARHSMLDDPALSAQQGADAVALYKQIDALLHDPKTVSIPTFSAGITLSEVVLQLELFQALDKYILKDADLAGALKDAGSSAQAYQDCAVNLPPLDETSAESQKAYFKAAKDCAMKADQALSIFFSAIATN